MYWFISYMYGASEKQPANNVIDEHPLAWQVRVNRDHPGQYILLSWNVISVLEYNKYRGVL